MTEESIHKVNSLVTGTTTMQFENPSFDTCQILNGQVCHDEPTHPIGTSVKETNCGFMLPHVKSLPKIQSEGTQINESCASNLSVSDLPLPNFSHCTGVKFPLSTVSGSDNNDVGLKYPEREEFDGSDKADGITVCDVRSSGVHVYSDESIPSNANEIGYESHHESFPSELYLTKSTHITSCTPSEYPGQCSTSLLVTSGRPMRSYSEFVPYQQFIYPQCSREPWHYGPILELGNPNVLLSNDSLPFQHDCFHSFPQHATVGEISNHHIQTSCVPTQKILTTASNAQLVKEGTPIQNMPFYVLPFVRPLNTPTEHKCGNSRCTTSEWTGVCTSYRMGLSNLIKHGSFSQTPGACLHHLHSPGLSDNLPSDLNSSVKSSHLTSDVVALATASIPPLQPASRFRKARIHETVEQWSHERFSVHDCHLKAVPDWVGDLQKKSAAYEQALTDAMRKKVRCMSCVVPKNDEKQPIDVPSECFVHPNVNGSETVNIHPKLSVLDYSTINRPLFVHQHHQNDNLFSFWDDGIRVHSCFSTIPRVHSHTCDGAACSENIRYMCSDLMNHIDNEYGSKLAEHSDQQRNKPDLSNLETDFVSSDHGCDPAERNFDRDSVNTCPLSPNNSLDPATAYLRRKNMHSNNRVEHHPTIQRFVHCGDNHSVDQVSQAYVDTDSVAKSEFSRTLLNHTDFVVCPRHSSSGLHCTRTQAFRFVNQLSNAAPPTTPNMDFHLLNDTCRSPYAFDLSCNCHMRPSQHIKSITTQFNTAMTNDGEYLKSYSVDKSANGDCDVDRSGKHIKYPIYTPLRAMRGTSKLSACRLYRHSKQSVSSVLRSRSSKFRNLNLHRSHTTSDIECLEDFSPPLNDLTKLTSCLSEDDPKRQLSKASSVLSERLEARIRASMEAIRSTLVNSFRDELTNVLAENISLRTELERMNSEVAVLRNYRKAFLAIRPFVSPKLYEQMCTEQNLDMEILPHGERNTQLCDHS